MKVAARAMDELMSVAPGKTYSQGSGIREALKCLRTLEASMACSCSCYCIGKIVSICVGLW